jgi:hypothetical protein
VRVVVVEEEEESAPVVLVLVFVLAGDAYVFVVVEYQTPH